MARVRAEQIEAFIQQRPLAGLAGPYRVTEVPAEADEQRFAIRAPGGACVLKRYEPSAVEAARREIAGLRLGSEMGLAPTLLLADDVGTALGGPTLAVETPEGRALGDGRLSAEDMQGWLFLLLTLHHLLPSQVDVVSSMSPDAAAWWQRTQPAWNVCRRRYGDPRYASLLDALTRLHAIVGVHVQAHQELWQRAARRPCHGNPVPAHVLRTASGRLFVEWNGFGLGDPAIEVGRVAALAALSGELSADQYVRFIADYLAGMRDVRDETLEERVRVFASVLPLGFCFVVLQHIAQSAGDAGEDRSGHVRQVERALVWIQDTLGVDVGQPAELLAPLRVTV